MAKVKKCRECYGTGKQPFTKQNCRVCYGTGKRNQGQAAILRVRG